MVSRLRPAEVKLLFEKGPYKLGDTISGSVEVSARGDIEVREGRVDLVCEERYTENFTVMVPDHRAVGRAQERLMGAHMATPRIRKRVTKEHKATYVHSSVVFLPDTRLLSGTTQSYNARLEIQEIPPRRAAHGNVKWKLVIAIDVARARDITFSQPVRVTIA